MSLGLEGEIDGTGLLVSVRSAEEARAALAGGADLIDIKEPRNGPLGAADPSAARAVVREVADSVPVSVALGELDQGTAVDRQIVRGVSFAKLGLAGWQRRDDWREHWRAAVASWPSGVAVVGVAYADWESAAAPPPAEILAEAAVSRLDGMLVDTFHKGRGGLFNYWSAAELERWVAALRASGMRSVVAGSLDRLGICRAARCRPDWVGVRGAACRGSRLGKISTARVAALRAALSSQAAQARA